MALNYSNNATRDDLSVPLLHPDNGKEEKQGPQDHVLNEKQRPQDHVLNIDYLSDKTCYKRRSNNGKKKQRLQGRSNSGKYQSYEEEKQGLQDNSLNTGYLSDQTYNRRSDIGKEQQIAAVGGKSSGDYLKPTLVSIGPKYIFSEKHFKGVAQFDNQKYKDEYFESFLKRGTKTTPHDEKDYREHLKDLMSQFVGKARNYYKDIGIKCPDDDKVLVNMLLIDGCFVVEFVLKCKKGDNDDPRIKDKGKVARKDMLCFENQLPFDVLDALYKKLIDYTKKTDPNPPSFIRLVKFAFASFAPNITLSNFYDDTKPEKPLDILHVLHSLCLPPINNNPHQNQTMEWPTVVHINSATELQDVGVSFNNTGEVYTMPREYGMISSLKESKDTTSLFDITFSGGVMKIPSFKVDGFTEIFLRNMIALEHRRTLNPKYYTDYARLMDHLVDTNKDVSLLRKNGTIHNLLGEDKNVADLFNSVCVKIDITTNFYFAPLYTAVNRHCCNTRLVWAARLKTDYFSDPWKGISSIAGAIVLSLGAALTLKSLLS